MAKGHLIRLRPFLRSRSLNNTLKAYLVGIFVDPAVTYGLSTIVLRVKDNNRLKAIQNTARRMILLLYSRRAKTVEELRKELPMRNLASLIQAKRLNLGKGLKMDKDSLILSLFESNFENGEIKEASHTRSWVLQLIKDAKEIWQEHSESWLLDSKASSKFEMINARIDWWEKGNMMFSVATQTATDVSPQQRRCEDS